MGVLRRRWEVHSAVENVLWKHTGLLGGSTPCGFFYSKHLSTRLK